MKNCIIKLTDKFCSSTPTTLVKFSEEIKDEPTEGIEQYSLLGNPSLKQIEESVVDMGKTLNKNSNELMVAYVYSKHKLKYIYLIDFSLRVPKVKKLDINSIKTIARANKLGIPDEKISFNNKISETGNRRVYNIVATMPSRIEYIDNTALLCKGIMSIGIVSLIIRILIECKVNIPARNEDSLKVCLDFVSACGPFGLLAYFLANKELKEEVKRLIKE